MKALPRIGSRRWLGWTAGGFSAVALVVAICELSGWPFLQTPLQSALTRTAGVPVTLDGNFSTYLLWNPRLHIDQLQVAPGGGVEVPHLLSARQVKLAWRWSDVWRWRSGKVLRVQALEAGTLDAHLVRGKDGRASWQLGTPDAATTQPDADPLRSLPRFGLLRVGAGRIAVDDALSQTRLTVELQGGEGDALHDGTRPGYRGTVAGRWKALPMNLTLRTGSALPLLQVAENDAQPGTLRVEGSGGAARLFFDGTASALLGERQLQGQLQLSGPILARVGAPLAVTLPQTPPFDLRGAIGYDSGVWRLQAERATIGRSRLNGDFSIRHAPHASAPERPPGRHTPGFRRLGAFRRRGFGAVRTFCTVCGQCINVRNLWRQSLAAAALRSALGARDGCRCAGGHCRARLWQRITRALEGPANPRAVARQRVAPASAESQRGRWTVQRQHQPSSQPREPRVQAIGRQPNLAIRAPDGAPVHYERHRPEQTTLYRCGAAARRHLLRAGFRPQPAPTCRSL